MCGTRYVIASRAVVDGAPVRFVSYLEPEHERDSGFLLASGEDDEEFGVLCFDCALDSASGTALDVAREIGEWHAPPKPPLAV